MKIHIGEKIKERSKELRIGPTELAKIVSTSKQNVYGIFKRESVDCSLLQKFCKALNYDFFVFYINPKLPPNTDSAKKPKPYPPPETDSINNQLMDLKEKYELLKKVNILLEEKKKK